MELLPQIKEPLTLLLARHEFTLLERRIYWAVLKALKNDQTTSKEIAKFETNKEFRIHISELFATDTNPSISDLKKAAERITSRRIVFEEAENDSFSYIVPFPFVKYQRGYIHIVMLANVVPYFINLSRGYSQYQLKAAISLTSEYAQLLYPRLCRFLDTGFWRIEVDELRQLLQAEKYPRYSNFKQRVLDVSLNEINTRTDITVGFEEGKEGKAVRWLTFSIRKKHEREDEYRTFLDEVNTALNQTLERRRAFVIHVLPNYNFTPSQQQQILDDEEKLNRFIRAESYVAQGVGDIKDPTAYIASSVFGYTKKGKKAK
ncbi:hypothetical protein GCM10023189_40400 [Nibrella saemangeumensis]|uniref:Initiator Rep protein WH1 domain-containing protein n=1 Tax=Nibrella saemangeumensis TaxID=1084526 RepID=A0ABP8N875_9BACT